VLVDVGVEFLSGERGEGVRLMPPSKAALKKRRATFCGDFEEFSSKYTKIRLAFVGIAL